MKNPKSKTLVNRSFLQRFKSLNLRRLLLIVSVVLVLPLMAITLLGVINSHDPSTLTKDGNNYFHFTTGDGIWYSQSSDLINWAAGPTTVFPTGTYPNWTADEVPGFNGFFWAPDVIRMNGYYYLYYSVSTFGSSRSAIGVVRSPSLNNPTWEDLGMVVDSNGGGSEINAIDAGVFRDTDGRVYMTYGSWSGGIGVLEINPHNGKAMSGTTHLYGGGHQDIEAPYIIKEGSYYYLYVNRGKCCQGLNSTYYIEVGRSTSVTGPYTGWRTVLGSEGKYIGPGHVGRLSIGACDYVSIHYYDGDDNGNAKLDILKLTYSASGWPEFSRNFSSFTECSDCPPTEITPYVQVNGGSWSQAANALINVGQTVKFGPHPTQGGSWNWYGPNGFTATTREITLSNVQLNQAGNYNATHTNASGCESYYSFNITVSGNAIANGTYRITNKGTNTSWDSWGCTGNMGEPVAQATYGGYTCQQWVVNNVGNGRYTLASPITGNVADVSGCSPSAGALLQLWSYWGGTCQQFEIVGTGDADGSFKIISANGGKVVATTSGAPAGQQLEMQTYNNSDLQEWYMVPLNTTSAGIRTTSEALVVDRLNETNNGLVVYPNPVVDQARVTFTLDADADISLEVFDLNGKLVREVFRGFSTSGSKEFMIKRENLKAGIYLLKLQSENGVITSRLMLK